ncbi:carbonic anhydrase [Leptothoe sp. PORK10 BA2]|uniref:carbonic anhydrase n=1 Tax=Leptothoe sp. PORK10 BA2 TaxID=3110254 RepID=UPI002B1ECCA8|nr:carbonic anhydrase [Leptothoe sp. PORK10 BA2]MEA5462276.1 carbonic anhydrase [Leptothoe sp. PORK10 BA2]
MKTEIDRRQLLHLGIMSSIGLLSQGLIRPTSAEAATLTSEDLLTDPDTALQALMAGNQRFSQHHPTFPHQAQSRLQEVSQAQHPFATILSCADSRVPVEILFDQGVGDIFDVRVAGNIVTPEVMGSLEYAIELLETPILMVLGHERCGAVTAAVQNKPLPGDIGTFVQAILPAVAASKGQAGDPVENAVQQNIKYQLEQLKRSELITHRLEAGTLKLVGSRYDLDTGKVSIIT